MFRFIGLARSPFVTDPFCDGCTPTVDAALLNFSDTVHSKTQSPFLHDFAAHTDVVSSFTSTPSVSERRVVWVLDTEIKEVIAIKSA
jgi:hypothetical protein